MAQVNSPARVGTPAGVSITAAGEELLRWAHAWQDEAVRALTAGWPAEDVDTLLTLMDRLVDAQTRLAAGGGNLRQNSSRRSSDPGSGRS
ncbi:hypothetical protein [Actinoplanes sp. RD1]|uniref:hypothetical protein n=1 Tax=Actinoplanes sp. RD1 TaxID=3064538 RepID=UPI002741A505|nr:hypothetical protein [Actinoplanes sp. RD1]